MGRFRIKGHGQTREYNTVAHHVAHQLFKHEVAAAQGVPYEDVKIDSTEEVSHELLPRDALPNRPETDPKHSSPTGRRTRPSA